jgi:hypothetical protein
MNQRIPEQKETDLDPQLQQLGLQLADVAVRNTAGAISDRIGASKARKKNEETIAELEEIISGLLSDKSELLASHRLSRTNSLPSGSPHPTSSTSPTTSSRASRSLWS